MKSYRGAAAAAIIAGIVLFGSMMVRAAEEYSVDPVHSFATFKVGHLGIAFVRGGFTDLEGGIHVDRDNPEKSSVEIIVKTASVHTKNDKRDEHLRSGDFFDVGKYPEMSFKSSKVRKIDDDTVEVTGNFNLLGVSKEVKVTVSRTGEGDDPWGGFRIGFETDFSIRRSEYGMTGLIPVAGDKVDISLNVEAIRK